METVFRYKRTESCRAGAGSTVSEQSCKISNLGNVYSLVSNIINEQNFIKGAEKTVIKKVKIYDELKSIVDLGDDKGLVMQVH